MSLPFRLVPVGDWAVAVEFEERIDAVVNARAIAVAEALGALGLPGVREIVPTFRSVTVYFDPLQTRYDELTRALVALASADAPAPPVDRPPVQIPVRYGGACGPDLADVARFASVSEQEVVWRHAARTYRVFMLGFVPGFAYLGLVDAAIAMPRRCTPRPSVPAGSVAIAGQQTGVYPSETPGGWHIIGRTDVRPFDLSRPDPFLLKAGDTVRFQAVAPS